MLEIGVPIICGLPIVATTFREESVPDVHQNSDPLNILDHFEILATPFAEHPDREYLRTNSKIPRSEALVVDVNCDIKGDFVIIIEDSEDASYSKRFHSRPKGDKPDTISFVLKRPIDGQLRVGVERDGETAFATFEGL